MDELKEGVKNIVEPTQRRNGFWRQLEQSRSNAFKSFQLNAGLSLWEFDYNQTIDRSNSSRIPFKVRFEFKQIIGIIISRLNLIIDTIF